jgi:hypothetical protein
MLQPLLKLYERFAANDEKFTEIGLEGSFFIDVYRSQPLEPELYEYFSLPALFVDYKMQGQGKNQPRLITMTLHILTDDMPDASNISEQQQEGFKRFLYNMTVQELLEGCKLGNSKELKFISEDIVDVPVINYHTQVYEFEMYLRDLIGDNPAQILGEFERLNIYGNLLPKKALNAL